MENCEFFEYFAIFHFWKNFHFFFFLTSEVSGVKIEKIRRKKNLHM